MEIVIDIGNSAAKVALFDQGGIVWRGVYESLTCADLGCVVDRYAPSEGVLSTTREHDAALEGFLIDKLRRFVVFDPASTPVPLVNLYATPHTLGADRLAAAVAAWSRFKGENIVVIDMGTAITVDFVSSAGEYLGGNISPGMFLRFLSLNRQTARLPMISECQFDDNELYGRETQSAIAQGVIRGILLEIEGYIDRNEGSKIFFTGGDALFFEKRIKKPIFVDYDAVLNGLHAILKYGT